MVLETLATYKNAQATYDGFVAVANIIVRRMSGVTTRNLGFCDDCQMTEHLSVINRDCFMTTVHRMTTVYD
jgi:hypothetical protein